MPSFSYRSEADFCFPKAVARSDSTVGVAAKNGLVGARPIVAVHSMR